MDCGRRRRRYLDHRHRRHLIPRTATHRETTTKGSKTVPNEEKKTELELQELEEMSAPGFWEGVSIGVGIVSSIIAAT